MSIVNEKYLSAIRLFKERNIIGKMESEITGSAPSGNSIPSRESFTEEGISARQLFIAEKTGSALPHLFAERQFSDFPSLAGNIENYIGMAQVPVGLVGPISITGSVASGEYYIPLATTEGALVSSYNRGARACYLSGPVKSVCLVEGIQRSPLFQFRDVIELGRFLFWVTEKLEHIRQIPSQTSKHARLHEMRINIEGNNLILSFEYTTGDAAGQNMVTICTHAICTYIVDNAPVKPLFWFLESNYSGDKKATALAFMNVRGKKVTSEIIMPRKVVTEVLRVTPEMMTKYCRLSTTAAIQSGAIGAQGHIANGLAALFIACGQDVACVAEASMGVTRFDVTAEGDLYASVTLPNLTVGTVGGGTHLPTQKECLEIMDCYGPGKARKFAEICSAMLLAGELSIVTALISGKFSQAHQLFGRKRKYNGAT